MKRYKRNRTKCHALPLFDWADEQDRRIRVTLPVNWLRRHHPLSIERAALVAQLAGLGGEL